MTDGSSLSQAFLEAVRADAETERIRHYDFWIEHHGTAVYSVSLARRNLRFDFRLLEAGGEPVRSFEWPIEPNAYRPDGMLRDPDAVAFDAWLNLQVELFAPPQGRHCCRLMAYYLAHEDGILYYWERLQQYAVPVRDGGTSGIVIKYCPWCGTELPPSLREIVFADHAMSDEFEMLDEDADDEDGGHLKRSPPPVGTL